MVDERIQADDLVWLKVSTESHKYISTGLFFFEGTFDQALVLSRIQAIVLEQSKLRSVPKRRFGRWVWMPYAGAVLENVRTRTITGTIADVDGVLSISEPGKAALTAMASEAFPVGRPQWTLDIIEGLTHSTLGTTTVLMFRAHHSVADGMAFRELLTGLCNEKPEPMKLKPTDRTTSSVLGTLRYLLGFLKPEPPSFLHGNVPSGFRMAISVPCPTQRIAALSKAIGASRNAIYVACLAKAIRLFLDESGLPTPKDMRIILPVARHQDQDRREFTNRLGYLHVIVPLHGSTETFIALEVESQIRKFMELSVDKVLNTIVSIIAKLPGWLTRWNYRFFSSRASMLVSCFPFPKTPLRIGTSVAFNVGAFPIISGPMNISTLLLEHGEAVTLFIGSNAGVHSGIQSVCKHFSSAVAQFGINAAEGGREDGVPSIGKAEISPAVQARVM